MIVSNAFRAVLCVMLAFFGSGFLVVCLTRPSPIVQEPLFVVQQDSLNKFVVEWREHYDKYRLGAFERRVRDTSVVWEGVVQSIDRKGDAFYIKPVGRWQQDFRAYVVLKQGVVPAFVHVGEHVIVEGHISSLGVLGVIVKGDVTEVAL
jgi:hypothetical protein